MTGILASLLAAYMGLVGALYVAQRHLMYHPGGPSLSPTAAGVPEMRTIELKTRDGLLVSSWYAPPKSGQPTLVYFHGNAGAIVDRAEKARPYLNHGYGVLLAGYRGYGGNPGSPSEQGLYADGEAVIEFLKTQGILPAAQIMYGESLGTGIAVEMAHRLAVSATPVGAVVLEAPFTSMPDAAAGHYPYVPAKLLVKDRYDSLAKISDIDAPLFIFHGDQDKVVPQKLGKQLFEAASEPKQVHWITGANHNNLYDFGGALEAIRFIDRFLRK